jgi:hypothetical protein
MGIVSENSSPRRIHYFMGLSGWSHPGTADSPEYAETQYGASVAGEE